MQGASGLKKAMERVAADDLSPVDPLVTFKAAATSSLSSSLTSLCFLGKEQVDLPERDEESSDGGSSDDDFEAHFQTSQESRRTDSVDQIRNRLDLHGVRVATCDFDGNVLIWDVGRSKQVGSLLPTPRGPGLALRRVQDNSSSRILYHSRDPNGTVSLHDMVTSCTIASLSTHSHTFCAASPCHGDANLVALPSATDSEVTVRDWRISPSAAPVARFPGSGTTTTTGSKHHGMLSSVVMWQSTAGTDLLVCGMEDGTLFFHDSSIFNSSSRTDISSSLSLGQDPILSLDLSASPDVKANNGRASCVCLAGLAGDSAELTQIAEKERGRVVVVKTSRDEDQSLWESRVRDRLGTAACKPGVAACQFRPDGRVFAAGGWDKRVRIYSRSGKPLAILRGHDKGIQTIDWSPNAAATGLMASGSSDGRICVWRCFGKYT